MKGAGILFAVGAALAQTPRPAVEVEFTMTPPPFRAGNDVKVRFQVRDKASGTPLENRYPSSWMVLDRDETSAAMGCKDRVQRILNADVFTRPEIDLNTYYVAVLNKDPSITVVDPHFGYGNTKLLATTVLPAVGEDWALSAGGKLLFVSMPGTGQVAAVDTSNWRLLKTIAVGPRAGRMALQPDGRYLWVALEKGIAAVDTARLTVAGTVAAGPGPHEIAISSDNRFALMTNAGAGSVTIIDTDSFSARSVRTGSRPLSTAFSNKSQRAYVADSVDGTLTAIDLAKAEIGTRLSLESGLGPIRFARDGRFGFLLNPERKRIHLLDAAVGRIVQTAVTDQEPDQVTFSEKLAYIRQRSSEVVLMVPLDAAGVEAKALPLAEFPAGQNPLGKFSLASPADSIVRAPGEDAVLVANPADKSIYFYKEGMAAPMGVFSNYGKEPRAVVVIDRSLRHTAPGVYETSTRLTAAGRYTVAFLLDSPQAVQCWKIKVEGDPSPVTESYRVERIGELAAAHAGTPVVLRFRILNGANAPKSGVQDVRILAYRAPGVWQTRVPAKPLADGVYEAAFLPPQPGSYLVHLESGMLGLGVHQNRLASITVE